MAVQQRRTVLIWFFLFALLPFLASFVFFLWSIRDSLLTTPREHIAQLKRTGTSTTLVSLTAWKEALAQDELCRDANAIVIGSSRVREIDARVVGTRTCNLYVDGLATSGFMRLARALPPGRPADPQIVYVGIDHFWLWSPDADGSGPDLTTALVDYSPLWRAWQVARTLTFFQWRDLVETVRRYRAGPQRWDDLTSVWYPDGHLEDPEYYRQKRAGQHPPLTHAEIEADVEALFTNHSVRDADLQRLAAGVRLLHSKGYAVRLYWNPVSPGHAAIARERFGGPFLQAIDMVDREATLLPLDRYLPADVTLDPRRFGCGDSDYFDSTHVDVDCIRRLFAATFRETPSVTSHGQPAVTPIVASSR